jgi:hypothetical protein
VIVIDIDYFTGQSGKHSPANKGKGAGGIQGRII